MRKITFISLALFFLVVTAAESSIACTCVPSRKPLKTKVAEAFKSSTAIFSGQVMTITPKSETEVTVRFNVDKTWKGKLPVEVTITTPENSAMCGYYFEIGDTYLVYAHGTIGDLKTTICSRTTLASNKQDIKYLNKLKRRKVRYS